MMVQTSNAAVATLGKEPINEGHIDEIFKLIRSDGPLCASQISVEILLPLKQVMIALEELKRRGIVELRPDRNRGFHAEQETSPWGLVAAYTRKL